MNWFVWSLHTDMTHTHKHMHKIYMHDSGISALAQVIFLVFSCILSLSHSHTLRKKIIVNLSHFQNIKGQVDIAKLILLFNANL